MADLAVQCPICGQSVRNSVINEHIDSSCAVKNGAHDVVEVEPPAARQLPGGGLKIVSWNVDGLDDRGLHARAVAVCRHLETFAMALQPHNADICQPLLANRLQARHIYIM